MLKKLRLRLALLSAVLSSIVLLGLGVVTVLLLEASREAQWQTSHRELMDELERFLQSENAVSLAWLEQQEQDNQMVLGIQDAGNELRFQGAYLTQTPREELLARAREIAAESDNRVVLSRNPAIPKSVEFEMKGDAGEKYLCDVSVFTVKSSFRSITTVRLLPRESGFWLWFAGFGALGVALLFCCGYWLSGRALRPVQQANLRQAEFTAAASHELKSPLASIRALSGEIMAQPEKAAGYAATIDRECGRMARLVSDLLVLSGSDAKTWQVKLEPLETDLLLIELQESMAPLARQSGHRLQLALPETALP
ncbi:MAG: histidine kinase dimerization/phospho-acceptor domain-containing protein, partial [Oscillospiraceae bacterium]|nr:histidine kinase dimerization/phospho-acceptor domain-containing protein [Oscillospiraceae bacterium]